MLVESDTASSLTLLIYVSGLVRDEEPARFAVVL
jgi:hypothetical protein